MASSPEKVEISLTLFLDKEKSKVLHAEAENEFVNVLLSFLTLPLGTISGLVSKESTVQPCTLNCISSLRQSVENMELRHFNSDVYKGKLLNPINPSVAKFKNLLHNFDDPEMSNCFVGHLCKPACFIVFDDLRVIPSDLNTTLWILHNLGIEYAPEKLTVYVTEKEVLDLLKFSLWSETPLTDLFLRKKLHIQNCETPLEFKFEMNEVETEEDWKIKIVRSKSQGKILFAEADDEFTDQIFSFLSETLGVIESLEEGNAGLGCIDNLYRSLTDFDTAKYFKSNPIQRYAKRGTMFMVTDDLSVTPFSSSSALSFLGECKVGEEDLEVRHISIGSDEILEIVKAAMFSSSALTIGLSPLLVC